jgi:hypothetical protein
MFQWLDKGMSMSKQNAMIKMSKIRADQFNGMHQWLICRIIFKNNVGEQNKTTKQSRSKEKQAQKSECTWLCLNGVYATQMHFAGSCRKRTLWNK